VAVERALRDLQTGQARPGTASRVRNYEHYLLPVFDFGPEGYALALAPDNQGRALAAIFTAEDGFEAFVQALAETADIGRLRSVEIPGPVLFAQLAQMSLDGLVFNCSGPVPPVAFALPFAQVMLEASPDF
jgi:hypothetical protein